MTVRSPSYWKTKGDCGLRPATSPSVVSSESNDSGSNDSAVSNWDCGLKKEGYLPPFSDYIAITI
jgi:hypothetical protein